MALLAVERGLRHLEAQGMITDKISPVFAIMLERMDHPVDPGIINELYRRFADFRRAYDPDGLSIAEFDTFGATLRTLRSFIASYRDLQATIREFMLPDPDVRRQG